MKFKGSTKPLLRRYTALREVQDRAFHAIFEAAAPRNDVRWQDCYRDYASPAEREAYDAAWRATMAFEIEMSGERRGWIENGRFNWYAP